MINSHWPINHNQAFCLLDDWAKLGLQNDYSSPWKIPLRLRLEFCICFAIHLPDCWSHCQKPPGNYEVASIPNRWTSHRQEKLALPIFFGVIILELSNVQQFIRLDLEPVWRDLELEKASSSLTLFGVICLADAVLDFGKNIREYDGWLDSFLQLSFQHGIKLTRDKLTFIRVADKFRDHPLAETGIKQYLEQVCHHRYTCNIRHDDVTRFDETICYLSSLLRDVSELMRPIRRQTLCTNVDVDRRTPINVRLHQTTYFKCPCARISWFILNHMFTVWQ